MLGVRVDGWLVGLIIVVLLQLAQAPYTKVEESFNMQAAHDLQFLRSDLSHYDHASFPGVVPRTFAGAGVLAVLASPFAYCFGGPKSIPAGQLATRAALGLLTCWSLAMLRDSLARRTSHLAGVLFMALCASQFHLTYYASRTLPNIFAQVLCCAAWSFWIEQRRPRSVIVLLTVATAIFRCDMLPLLGMVGLHLLFSRSIGLFAAVKTGLLTVAVALLITVPIDSLLWGRLLWPELDVFRFNVIGNRSHEWGVSPWHWYWTSALPRSLLAALPLWLVCPAVEPRMWGPAALAAAFVSSYSFLPHKEVRFLFPVLPLCTACAAASLARLYTWSRMQATGRALWHLAALPAAFLTLAAVALMTRSSHHNYPGAAALAQTSHMAGVGKQSIHVEPYPAMSGITRFQARSLGLHLDKTEGLSLESLQHFDVVISGERLLPGFDKVHETCAFKKLKRHSGSKLGVAVCLQPHVFVHRRSASLEI
mmetsp:Transcript_3166/g.9126  ORF Transcript_3166/g.9126 Transcript_3166/m.9126 type:complete len:480 (-) Transcript_3166:2014-3453(-)